MLFEKKKSAGLFFTQNPKQKKGRVPVFDPRSGNARDTGTRRHTGTKEKSEQQQQFTHIIIIILLERLIIESSFLLCTFCVCFDLRESRCACCCDEQTRSNFFQKREKSCVEKFEESFV